MVVPVSQEYIDMIKAFRADCELLIGRFKEKEEHNLLSFLSIWHDLDFQMVYDTKYSRHGLDHDFLHDTLQIAKLIMMKDHFTGGMFLMHGLYSLQDDPKATIRLELDEFLYMIKKIRMKEEGRTKKTTYELALILTTWIEEEAFDYVMFGREFDMEGQHRASIIYNNHYEFRWDEDNPRDIRSKDWMHEFSEEEIPKEMKNLENDYLVLKSKVKAMFPYLNLSLDMVDEDITSSLMKALTSEAGCVTEKVEDHAIGAKRRSLKNRKMKIKRRYKRNERNFSELGEDVDNPEEVSPVKKVKKSGSTKGHRKFFFDKVINHQPEMIVDGCVEVDENHDEDAVTFQEAPPKTEQGFPDLEVV